MYLACVERPYGIESMYFQVLFSIEGMSEMAQEATGSPSPFPTPSVRYMQGEMIGRIAYSLY